MSSFVVDKKEFIKAAGLMYGIESSKRDAHQYFLDRVHQMFSECYEMNLASVNEQYGRNDEADPSDYTYLFEEYADKGKKIWEGKVDGMTRKDIRLRLWSFFRSVEYQIENDPQQEAVSFVFLACLGKLWEDDLRQVEGWWGEIEI